MTFPNAKHLAARVAALLVFATALARIVPHPWNFTPLVATALFGGARLGGSWWALVTPLVALAIGDAALGLFPYPGMGWVYGATLAIAFGGRFALRDRARASWAKTLGATLVAGALFFFVTNFGVWTAGHLYTHTLDGLATCFVAALPFYGNQIAGDLVFAGALFGFYELALRLATRGAAQSSRARARE